jgi:arylsulfatase A-like enzyme
MRAWLSIALVCAACGHVGPANPHIPPGRNVIIVVWDGLRPDAITALDTPNLVALRDRGTDFTANHATYPTFTMMNAASFATGAFPDATGFYGNVEWLPTAIGKDSAGKPIDFRQPVFSEDYGVLDGLKLGRPQLMAVETLFDVAHAAGMATAAVGKTGPAYLQDNARGGIVLDEKTAWPLAFARGLIAAGVALPPTAIGTYAPGELALRDDNGNPVAFAPQHKLADEITTDPEDVTGSPYQAAIRHLFAAYLTQILPTAHPRLSVIWLRDPDTTQHNYGIGTANWLAALRGNDELLGALITKLRGLDLTGSTDLLVVSDHGHSNVAGPAALFPLRDLRDGAPGDLDPRGHAVAGLVRISDILRRAGLLAFDGLGCTYVPIATGIRRDGAPVYPTLVDPDGAVCGKPGQKYQVPPAKVPAELPAGAIIVAVNGGSDYLYVPDHDPAIVARAVRVLQERGEIGAIFVDDRYAALAGTLPLSTIHARHAAGDNPDIIFSYDFDPDAVVENTPGTEMGGMLNGASYRGMHGSFSPRDVHNVLIAAGPDFLAAFRDPLPTGNVDVAPTVARLLGLRLPHAQGRVLLESLVDGALPGDYHVAPRVVRPAAPATGLTVRLPTDPDGKDIAPGVSTYTFELHMHVVTYAGRTFTYFEQAKATRR